MQAVSVTTQPRRRRDLRQAAIFPSGKDPNRAKSGTGTVWCSVTCAQGG